MNNAFGISKFFLYLSVFAIIIVTPTTLFPFIVGKYVFFRACVYLALLAVFLGFLRETALNRQFLQRIKELFRSPLTIAVSFFTLITLLSVAFGVDPAFSFWSSFERGEGGLQVLTLYVYYLLLSSLFTEKSQWRLIFGFVMTAALLVIFYGMLASGIVFNPTPGFIGPSQSDPGFRFQGTIGNPAYVAAYLIFVLGFALTLFAGKVRRMIVSASGITAIVCVLMYLIFFWLAATRGAFIGLLASLILGLAYVGYSLPKWRKWLIVLFACAVIGLVSLVALRHTDFVRSLPGARIFDLSFTTETLKTRTVMWQIAYRGALERPILGWGPENFTRVFDKHYITSNYTPGADFGVWFDRAHSVVFDTLAASGFLGLLAYISIFVTYYVEFFRSRLGTRDNLFIEALIFAFPVAYFVQGLALFDVLSIYMNLFLLLAFAYFCFGDWRKKKLASEKIRQQA